MSNTLSRISFYRSIVGGLGLKVVGAGMTFAGSVVLARFLGAESFGHYVFLITVTNLFVSVACLGLPTLVTREVAKFEFVSNWVGINSLLRCVNRLVMLSMLAMLPIFVLLLVGMEYGAEKWFLVISSLALLVVFSVYSQVRAGVFRGVHKVVWADVPELVVKPTSFVVMILVFFLIVGNVTSTVAIVGQLAAVTISFIVGLFLLKKYVPKVNNVGECKKGIIHWARDVRPFFVMTVIGLLDAQCGIYALRLFSEVREIGYFQVALQVVNLVVIGLNSVNLPLQPRLSQSWSVGNLDEVRRLLERGVVLSSAAALLGGAVIFGGAEVVVRVFGDEYLGAANVMRLMVVGQMFNALSGSCAMLHIAAGRQAVVTRALFVAFLSNGLLGLILVPLYGAMGAAVASAFSLMIWNISLAYKAWVEYGINTSIFGKQFKLS